MFAQEKAFTPFVIHEREYILGITGDLWFCTSDVLFKDITYAGLEHPGGTSYSNNFFCLSQARLLLTPNNVKVDFCGGGKTGEP